MKFYYRLKLTCLKKPHLNCILYIKIKKIAHSRVRYMERHRPGIPVEIILKTLHASNNGDLALLTEYICI